MRRHFIRLAPAPFTSSSLVEFDWVPFAVCNAWQRSRRQNLRRVDENSVPILSCLWITFHMKFSSPRTFQRPGRLFVSRFIQKIFTIKSRSRRKTEQMYKFLDPNFWEAVSRLFYGRLLARYTLCLKKVPTFKLSLTLSNRNRFSKCLHCWKAYEICYKT